MAAAIFAVHPMQAEAVNYIWARSIVLATLLCLAACGIWLEGRVGSRSPASRWRCWPKRNAPPFRSSADLLLERKRLRLHWAPCWRSRWPPERTSSGQPPSLPARPRDCRRASRRGATCSPRGRRFCRYLRLLVAPYGFTVDPEVRVPPLWLGLLAWALSSLAVRLLRLARGTRRRACGSGGLILLIPSSSIFPAADLAADRRMYLPMLAFAAAAGLLLDRVEVAACGSPWPLVLAAGQRHPHLGLDERSARCGREAVRRAPGQGAARKSNWRAPYRRRKHSNCCRRRADLAPHDPAIAAEIGKMLLAEGQADAALEEFGRALALDPRRCAQLQQSRRGPGRARANRSGARRFRTRAATSTRTC